MNRRFFLKTNVLFPAGLFLETRQLVAQPTRTIRKSVINLPPDAPDLIKYRRAVDVMTKLPETNPRSWVAQAKIHLNSCPHSNWWFLPWHRAYIYFFEQICRDVLSDPSFALPYWDWTAYPRIPAPFLDSNSPLFHAGRRANGNFELPTEAVGVREMESILRSNSLITVFSGGTKSDNQREDATSGELEGTPHNSVHILTGGDMRTFMSPLDPLFWLHHCNIDRIWLSWSALNGNQVPTDNLWQKHDLTSFYDVGSKKQISVRTSSTIMADQFGARYDKLETLSPGIKRFSSTSQLLLVRRASRCLHPISNHLSRRVTSWRLSKLGALPSSRCWRRANSTLLSKALRLPLGREGRVKRQGCIY